MSVLNMNGRQQVNARQQTKEFADQARELRLERNQARERLATVRTQLAEGKASATDLAVAVNEVERIDGQLADIESAQRELVSGLADGISGAGMGRETLYDDPSVQRLIQHTVTSSAPVGNVVLGTAIEANEVIQRIRTGRWDNTLQATDSAAGVLDLGDDAARLGPWHGIVPQTRRRLRILDLIPTLPFPGVGNRFDYTREEGTFDPAEDLSTGPYEVAELSAKPPAAITLVDDEVKAATIAAWFKTPRQQIADIPTLQGVLQGRLFYMVMRRLENQIVGGDGTGENLTGILHTSGVGDIAYASGVPLTDLILDGSTAVELLESEPNAVVVNPSDKATALKALASTSGVRLDSGGAFATPATDIWGLPMISSTAIAAGTALVADFTQTTIFVREGVVLRISDSDQDDFVKNRLTLLGEMRAGLAIWNSGAFALVNLAS